MITKKLFIVSSFFAVILCFCGNLYSQGVANIEFINNIADKDQVTVGEAVRLFRMITENKFGSFEENVNALKSQGALDADFNMQGADEPMKRGLLAKMIAGKLNLSDSLFYLFMPVERYAFRACVAENIMQVTGSEWDILSGGELIEVMTAVSVALGTAK